MNSLTSNSAVSTINIGKNFAKSLIPGNIIALHGTMGAGKTTFVKGIARGLDISEEITSPTYTIISEYKGRIDLYHMDLYRIDSIEEFEMLGTEEFMFANNITIVEWSEKITDLLPENTINVNITILPDKTRNITIVGL